MDSRTATAVPGICVLSLVGLLAAAPSTGSPLKELLKGAGKTATKVTGVEHAIGDAARAMRFERAQAQAIGHSISAKPDVIEDILSASAKLRGPGTSQIDDILFRSIDRFERGAIRETAAVNSEQGVHNVYVVAPSDQASYKKVFSGNYSAAYVDEISTVKEVLRGPDTSAIFARADDGKEAFRTAVKEMRGKVVSVIGHNEIGMFKFLNGDSLHLADLASICNSIGKKCVFFSCDAQSVFRQFRIEHELGANTPLNFLEAARASAKLGKFLGQNKNISPEQLARELPAIVDNAVAGSQMSSKITVMVGASVGGATLTGIVVTLDAKNDTKKLKSATS